MKIIFDKPKNDVVYFDNINDDDYYIVVTDKYNNIFCILEDLESASFKLINLQTSEILYDCHFHSYKTIIEYYKSQGYEFEAFLKYKDLINFLNENCK